MKVFVTGGSGFVGREILWRLHEAGHGIRLLARRPDKEPVRQLAYRHRAELVAGTCTDLAALSGGMEGCGAVIHLVGIISEIGRTTFERAHVEATQTVLAAARASGVRRLIHMSALGARAGARSRYHQTKWTAEELVRGSGLDWTIFRPSVIYGREDGFVNLLAKICRWSPVIPVFGPGTNQLQPVAVEYVAHCFVEALSKKEALGRTMDLCGTERFSMDEIYRAILQVTRRRRPLIHLPMLVGKLQAVLMEAGWGILGKVSPLTRDQLLMLEEDNIGEPGAAMGLFEFAPESFIAGIAKYVR